MISNEHWQLSAAILNLKKKKNIFSARHRYNSTRSRDIASSMFNGPCQLHGSAGFLSAADADDALLTPTGSSSRYVNSGVITTGMPAAAAPPTTTTTTTTTAAAAAAAHTTAGQQHPHGLRPRSSAAGAASVPPCLSDLPQPCSTDRCLMSPGLTCPDVYMALEGVQFLAEHTRREQYTIRVRVCVCLCVCVSILSFSPFHFLLTQRKRKREEAKGK